MWRWTSARISSGVIRGTLVVVEIVVVVLVALALLRQMAVRLRQREHLVDVGADRVVGDALEQGVPDLVGRCHGDLLDARGDDRSRWLRSGACRSGSTT